MNALLRAVVALVFLAVVSPVRAESLRCGGEIADEGDSRIAVLYKCGPPLLADAFCANVYYPGSFYPVPPSLAGGFVPCQTVEEWVYDRGPGNFMAVVRFRGGRVQSIHYGRLPP
jgi:hypothetical protein